MRWPHGGAERMTWTLAELASWCGGSVRGDPGTLVQGVSTDTRTVSSGDLFVAIRGERFDGHSFLDVASARDAAAALVSEANCAGDLPSILVADTVAALGDVARMHRKRFAGPVVAITGSNGKTTTKELCADILENAGARVRRSPGNLNNHIGLPLSVLGLRHDDEVLVVELGMNHEGEIDALARIASPTVGAITQIGAAHLGLLGSLDAIGAAKGELLDHIREEGAAVLNADDRLVMAQRDRFAGRALLFGFGDNADFRAELAEGKSPWRIFTPAGSCRIQISLPGRHLIQDALCAAAAAHATGLLGARPLEAIRNAVGAFRGVVGRLTLHDAPGGIRLLDDSYNANPSSVDAALQTLQLMRGSGRTLAVLGDMLELGVRAEELHQEVGRTAARTGVDALIGLGPLSEHTVAAARSAGVSRTEHVIDVADATRLVGEIAEPGDTVLIKGSRGMRMERIATALRGEN